MRPRFCGACFRGSCRGIWLGRLDSDQRVQESKSCALPLGDGPIFLRI